MAKYLQNINRAQTGSNHKSKFCIVESATSYSLKTTMVQCIYIVPRYRGTNVTWSNGAMVL